LPIERKRRRPIMKGYRKMAKDPEFGGGYVAEQDDERRDARYAHHEDQGASAAAGEG
jgi:hypothetical protein